MSRIPQHFIDEIVARTDIVDVITSRVPLKKAGREFKACCPFHDEKTPSFTVSPDKQFYHCFGCGAHGTAVGFLLEYERLSFVEAIEELAGRLGMEVPREKSDQPRPSDDLYDLLARADRYFREQLRGNAAAIGYLKGRGVVGEVAARFGIGYAPASWDGLLKHLGGDVGRALAAGLVIARDDGSGHYDRFRGRIMFPIRDHRGRTVAFGGRAMEDKGPKYLNSPETEVFHKGRELYGLYEARQSRDDLSRILVVEGYMDVVGLAQYGINNCVATLGTATTPDHLSRLFRIARDVVFCFDGDRAGRAAAWRALRVSLGQIRDGRQVRFLFVPEGEDPDSLVRNEGADAFRARLDEAVPLSEFLIEHLRSETDTASLDGRARLAELARPLVAQVPEGVYRDMLTERLAQEVGLPGERLARHLPKAEPAVPRRPARAAASGARPPLVRQCIALLLKHPSSAADANVPDGMERWTTPGVDILTTLLEQLAREPHLTTAGVLERWRSHEHFRHLEQLASGESLINEAQAATELIGLIGRLSDQERARRRNALLEKSAERPLDEEELRELNALLASRVSNNDTD